MDFVREAGIIRAGIPRAEPRRQGSDPARRRARADRSGGDPLLSRQAFPGSTPPARKRPRRRGANHLMDVVHRLDDPSPAESASNGGTRDCRTTAWPAGMGGQRVLDRRHPPVSPLLALLQLASSDSSRFSRPLGALRPHDGAPGGSVSPRNRKCSGLPPAAVASWCALTAIPGRPNQRSSFATARNPENVDSTRGSAARIAARRRLALILRATRPCAARPPTSPAFPARLRTPRLCAAIRRS